MVLKMPVSGQRLNDAILRSISYVHFYACYSVMAPECVYLNAKKRAFTTCELPF